ncbi:hypothetical protein A9Q84_18045 [Halobacteriovorax marinus]|uniref:Uncharacterized protein n=1 Tax=Halobacteriovorax marinus TaxID=97084 RepID=A0A1Y5F3F3_9BACT|nr:hypothetical protein A9Q84_18045 [Halobacteriovorax marinus]
MKLKNVFIMIFCLFLGTKMSLGEELKREVKKIVKNLEDFGKSKTNAHCPIERTVDEVKAIILTELPHCADFKSRSASDLGMAMYDDDIPNKLKVASIEDVLGWFTQSAASGKLLFVDQKYGSCLGCENMNYGMLMNDVYGDKDIVSGLVDFQNLAHRKKEMAPGEAIKRDPYEKIKKTPAFQLMQVLLSGKKQAYNDSSKIEDYPLVAKNKRDGMKDQIKEDQKNRLYTRAHFPNLTFINGSKINKKSLNALCKYYKDKKSIPFKETDDGRFTVGDKLLKEKMAQVIGDNGVLVQMLNFNLYKTGNETSEDLHTKALKETFVAVKKSYKTGVVSKKVPMFNRWTSKEVFDQGESDNGFGGFKF